MMVMKDKLVKTNHTSTYYLAKKISIALLAVFTLAFIIAVPTYIASKSNKKTTALAEENNSEVVEDNNSGEEVDYDEYND